MPILNLVVAGKKTGPGQQLSSACFGPLHLKCAEESCWLFKNRERVNSKVTNYVATSVIFMNSVSTSQFHFRLATSIHFPLSQEMIQSRQHALDISQNNNNNKSKLKTGKLINKILCLHKFGIGCYGNTHILITGHIAKDTNTDFLQDMETMTLSSIFL